MKKNAELINAKSQPGYLNLELKTYHNKYVDKVLRSISYEALMWIFMQAESPSKEISESYAALSNLKKVCKISDYTCLHLGDGGWGRTAAIFAFFTKSFNISIDPMINQTDKFRRWMVKWSVDRLKFVKDKFENTNIRTQGITYYKESHHLPITSKYWWDNPKILISVHGHVDLEKAYLHFNNVKYMYSNPCCKPGLQTISDEFMKQHNISKIVDKEDFGILSPHRRVIIYKCN